MVQLCVPPYEQATQINAPALIPGVPSCCCVLRPVGLLPDENDQLGFFVFIVWDCFFECGTYEVLEAFWSESGEINIYF